MASGNKQAAVMQKFRSFMQTSYGSIHVPDDWLGQCAEFIIDQFQNESIDSYVKMVYQQLLNFDLNEVDAKCLPEDLGSRQTGFLEGSHFLQVSLCLDNTQSYFSILQKLKGTENENALVSADNDNNILATFSSTYYQQPQNQNTNRYEKRNRLYTLYLTDGRTHVTAVEKKPISFLNDEIWPGTKIALSGRIMISGGVLFIGPENLKILGGIVDGWNSNECLIKTIEGALAEKLDLYHPRDINGREKTATFAELSSNVKKQPTSYTQQQQQQQSQFRPDVKPVVIKTNPSQVHTTSPILVKQGQSTSQSKNNCHQPLNELNEDEFLMNFNPESLVKPAYNQPAPNNTMNRKPNPITNNNIPKKTALTLTAATTTTAAVPKMNKIEVEEDEECLMVLNQIENQSRIKTNPETSAIKRLPSSSTISSMTASTTTTATTSSNLNANKKVKTSVPTVVNNIQDDEDFMYLNDIDENYNQYTSKIIHKAPPPQPPVIVEQPSIHNNNSLLKVNKLSDLTDQTFTSRCCHVNFDADSTLAICSHQVKQCYFLTLRGSLQQFKHKWYQECVVCCRSEPSVRLENCYLGDEPLCKLLEMTAREARELHRKSMEQGGDEYVKYFEHKRNACEFQLEKMTCHVTFKFDFTRKKFSIVSLDGVTLNR